MSTLRPRSRWHLWTSAVVGAWLVGAVLVALVHPFVPESGWLMVHLLTLGAVTNAVLVWSAHFADALLKVTAPGGRRGLAQRIAALNLGVTTVSAGIVVDIWQVTLVGALLLAGTVAIHGVVLARQSARALPSRFGGTVRYYVAASATLPVGAALGVLMARGLDPRTHGRVLLAHLALNVLGWVGLTVIGTLLTLWPTILRTRIAHGAERAVSQALPALLAALGLIVAGALSGWIGVTAAGVAGYLAGALWALRPMVGAARNRPPQSYAAWSVLAAVTWLCGSLAWLVVLVATAGTWSQVDDAAHQVAVPLAAGFVAQVLLGALSYLLPVVLGRAPSRTRAASEALDRGAAFRVVVINLGLLVALLPVPSVVRVLVSMLVLGGLAAFLFLAPRAVRVGLRAPALETDAVGTTTPGRPPVAPAGGPSRHTGLAVVGLAAVALAVATGAAVDPTALGGTAPAASEDVRPTGHTTTVRVEARGMRFVPASVSVPAGDRLVLEVLNRDTDVHDLALETGHHTGRLAPGATGRLTVDVVGRALDGWCTIVGHRRMGMVFAVQVTGAPTAAGDDGTRAATSSGSHDHHTSPDARATPQPTDPAAPVVIGSPQPGLQARDARLAPASTARVHRVDLTVREVEREVAPGIRQRLWTFDGTAPGPVLRGRVGDRFEITLHNDATMGHSIDFHAGALAPDRPMRTIAPGQSLSMSFTATRAGVWMYHCSTMPMSVHIANGMFGAVVIDPPGLPEVDREYLLVQSELYLGKQGGPVDADKVATERPDAVVFNGYANQYDADQLPARVGERVRLWVLDAGPNRASSFHVVGGQFDTVWTEGRYQLERAAPGTAGAQVLPLLPAQGGFVELTLPQPGHYPFVSHVMVDAERGAHGVLDVTP